MSNNFNTPNKISELKPDYYPSTGKKIYDCFVGLMGSITISFLCLYFIFKNNDTPNYIITIIILVGYATLLFVYFLLKKRKKFIALGILTVIIIASFFAGLILILAIGMMGYAH